MFNRISRAAGTLLVLAPLIGCATPGPSAATQASMKAALDGCYAGAPYACESYEQLQQKAVADTQAATGAFFAGAGLLLLGAIADSRPDYTTVRVYQSHGSYGRHWR